MIKKIIKVALDGFTNIFSGLRNKSYDKVANTEFAAGNIIPDKTLINIIETEGLGKKTVDILAGDMLKEGFDISCDTDGLVLKRLNELKWKKIFKSALDWDIGLGGSIIYVGIDDGGEPEDEVNEKNIKNIAWLKVYDKTEVNWEEEDLYQDEDEPKYGEVEIYTIQPAGRDKIRVHETRILRFDGENVTNTTRLSNGGWGNSLFQSVYDQLEAVSVSWSYTYRTITKFIAEVLKISNLFALATSKEGEKQIQDRLKVRDLTRDMMSTELIDTDEEFELKSVNVSGLDKLVTIGEIAYASVVDIPLTRLYGQTPQGLNATGESEERNYNSKIKSMQEYKLKDNLNRLVTLIMLSKEGDFKGIIPKDFSSIEFKPLWQESQETIIKNKKIQAETDHIYIQDQVLMPEEIRDSRFGGETYSYDTIINETLDITTKEINDLEEEEKEEDDDKE